jgi:hypothetical protein
MAELADRAVRRGSAASRQRGAVAMHGRQEDAVDLLLEETASRVTDP